MMDASVAACVFDRRDMVKFGEYWKTGVDGS